MNEDRWLQLWRIATDDPRANGVATIKVFDNNPDAVLLLFPDGSKASVVWLPTYEVWHFEGFLNTAPCDVKARDSL